ADDLRQRIGADPTVWCVKTLVPFTGRPAVEHGTVTERGFALRAFALAQESGYTVLPGGLGQVLVDGADAALLHSSAARDVWVPSSEDLRAPARVAT
ncbi:circularly permuted type 2 ATP-grasp protein, partial [Mycobacterium kansasii]